MKTLRILIITAIAAMFLYSCEGTEGGGNDSKTKVDINLIDCPTEYTVAQGADTVLIRFTVTSNDSDVAWKITSTSDWCKADPAEGNGHGEVNLCFSANETAKERVGEMLITSGSESIPIKITQSLYAGAMPDEPWFSKALWERNDLQLEGLRGPVKSIYISCYTTYDKFFYDENGHLLKTEYHDLDKNSTETGFEHSYDSEGRRIKSIYYYVADDPNNSRTISYEYNNGSKIVPTDPFTWLPIDFSYMNSTGELRTLLKGLSKVSTVDVSAGSESSSTVVEYVFGSDGNLTITYTSTYSNGTQSDKSTYTVVYDGDYPVSCEEGGTTVTYASDGWPATYKSKHSRGYTSYTMTSSKRSLTPASMEDPQPYSSIAPEYWANYSYNSNGDMTKRVHAYYGKDQVYTDDFDKYFYDKYGNWIQRDETIEPAFQHGQRGRSTVTREIEYYE